MTYFRPFLKEKLNYELTLALGESVAHLNYLFKMGIIKKEVDKKGVNLFVK